MQSKIVNLVLLSPVQTDTDMKYLVQCTILILFLTSHRQKWKTPSPASCSLVHLCLWICN